ncbi:MAG: NAD(+)/NADH kinase [Phycisphaerales bacterium]|jgi:NAD+ kinase|nr:NAD(+)/NADH kinase [Phycisphaerales bacterium]
MTPDQRPRLLVLADVSRASVSTVLREIDADLAVWGKRVHHESSAADTPLSDEIDADLAVVVGGDGAVISQARRLIGRNIPLIGVNCGRLGFLAAFDHASLKRFAADVFGQHPPVRDHMVMQVTHESAQGSVTTVAVNDAVITSGPPYSMIELALRIGNVPGPHMRGDGLIVASPTGSTAHNLSAGGPILGPGVGALVVSPLAPQSLAFRPIVLDADPGVELELVQGNEGTTLVLDGQQHSKLREGDRIAIRRHAQTIPMVTRPDEPFWRILLERMRWAAPPVFR